MRRLSTPGQPFSQRIYFDDGEIDEICEGALQASGCMPAAPGPVEVDLFIEKHFGCPVVYQDLGPAVLGFAAFGPDGSVELVGASRSLYDGTDVGDRRARATLAHEAGHGLLHAEMFAQQSDLGPVDETNYDLSTRRILCRQADLDRLPGGGYHGKWWEWQANQAIGGLLLPRPLVRRHLALPEGRAAAEGVRTLSKSDRRAAEAELAERFEVNEIVARIRLDVLFGTEATAEAT